MILTAISQGASAGPLYPDFVGRRALFVGSGSGPNPYVQATGDPVSLNVPNWYIDAICGGVMSTDRTTIAVAGPGGTGTRQTWSLFYVVASTGAPVANGVDLSAKQFQIGAFVGQF